MEVAKSWDAIVVGAGLGGLAAANRLLREGWRVLVLDGAPHPGGTAYVFRRGDFLFPMGPLGCGYPRLVTDILRLLGMQEPPTFRRVHYSLRAFGLHLPLSLPFPEMVSRFSAAFPRREGAIRRFFEDMEHIYDSLLPLPGPSSLDPLPFREGRRDEAPPPNGLGKPYAFPEGIREDWRLHRILGSMGTREPYSDPALLSAMWNLLCRVGIHYPAGGMHGLCDLLAAPLGWRPLPSSRRAGMSEEEAERAWREAAERAWGRVPLPTAGESPGRLLLRRPAAGIEVKGGEVRGVVLADGTFLEAPVVVSNADFQQTFLRLLPPENLPADLRKALREATLSASNLQVCLGIDTRGVDLSAFREGSRIIHRRESGPGCPTPGDPDWSASSIHPAELSAAEMEITLLSADDPDLAPPGRHVLVIRTSAEHAHFAPFRPSSGKRTADYAAYKESLAAALVKEASSLVPGLERGVVTADVASPLTFEERGGRSRGAVAGWSWERPPGGTAVARELVCTPVSGLYMAGHQAFSMLLLGGVPSALLSGLHAAEHALAGKGPVDVLPIPAG